MKQPIRTSTNNQSKYKYYNPLYGLHHIKTIGELREHIGDILFFGVIKNNLIEDAWLCKLQSTKNIFDLSDYVSTLHTLLKGNDYVQVYHNYVRLPPFKRITFMQTCMFNKQNFICVPNDKTLLYYHLCLEYIKNNHNVVKNEF